MGELLSMGCGRVWKLIEDHAEVLLSFLISFQLQNPGVLLRCQVFNIVLEFLVYLALPVEGVECPRFISVLLSCFETFGWWFQVQH